MRGLGELEAAAMDVLWDSAGNALTVREILDRLSPERDLAYTTALTVLTHLYEKGWARRNKRGRAYTYFAAQSRAQATASALREILDASADSQGALIHFARSATQNEQRALLRGMSDRPDRRR